MMLASLSRPFRSALDRVLWAYMRPAPPPRIAALRRALALRRARHLMARDLLGAIKAERTAALRAEVERRNAA